METYIVRIYRRRAGRTFSGVLIEPVSGVEKAFRNIKELMSLLQNMGPVTEGAARPTHRLRQPQRPSIPVKVSGRDIKGKNFTEKTDMKDMNTRECVILLDRRVKINTVLTLSIGHGKSSETMRGKVVHIGQSGVEVSFTGPPALKS
ncbi:MAG: hypothetical protein ACE5DR_07025 [Thermodesulfobacteriota bacterium]